MQRRIKAAFGGTAAIASLALVLTGCASGGSPTPTDGGGEAAVFELPGSLRDAVTGECTIDPIEGVDVQAAGDYIQPWLNADKEIVPTALGWGALEGEVPDGLIIGYANNMTPVGDAQWRPYIEAAAEAAGGTFVNYPTGPDPQSAQAGFNTILADAAAGNLDILIVGAVSPRTVQAQAEELLNDYPDVQVVWGADPYANRDLGLDDSIGDYGGSIVNGNVLAAAAVYYTCGAATDFTWYTTNDLEFTSVNLLAANEFLAELNPTATLREVVGSITSAAATDLIIPDLQGHPNSQFFVSPLDQYQIGIKDAAETAGIDNWYGIGQSSLPANVDQIKNGAQYGGYTLDFEQFMFQLVDQGLRMYLGEWPADGYGEGNWELINASMSTLITPGNVNDLDIDANGHYTAVPDTAAKYVELWGK